MKNKIIHHQLKIRQPAIWRAFLTIATIIVIVACGIIAVQADGTVPVTVNIDCQYGDSYTIRGYVNGISEEMGAAGYNDWQPGGYWFSSTNTQAVQLFQNVGFRTIRIGGNSADGTGNAVCNQQWTNNVNQFFSFAQACNLHVIWTLDQHDGTASVDATMANYIYNNYSANLLCFAIGNEPEQYTSYGSTWLNAWNNIASAVTTSVPSTKLGGMDAENGDTTWEDDFANAEVNNASVNHLQYHYEPCGSVSSSDTDFSLCESMLAPAVDTDYENLNNVYGATAASDGYLFSLTEFNPNYTSSKSQPSPGVSEDTYGMALFALDALHWWAQNGMQDVHFHSGLNKFGGFHDAFYYDSSGVLQAYPVLYGSAAYQAGTPAINPRGATVTSISNPDNVNLTVYATEELNTGNVCTNLYVTIINKSFGGAGNPNGMGTNALVKIIPLGIAMANPTVHAMWLVQSAGAVTATNNVTLGGASINGAGAWTGQWKDLGIMQSQYGYWNETVTNATAVILEFSAPNN